MSDGLEKVWVDEKTMFAYADDHGDGLPEYIRADIHKAEIARLREALEERRWRTVRTSMENVS